MGVAGQEQWGAWQLQPPPLRMMPHPWTHKRGLQAVAGLQAWTHKKRRRKAEGGQRRQWRLRQPHHRLPKRRASDAERGGVPP
jgi:hypothetical protein